jgi:hypothetical protein
MNKPSIPLWSHEQSKWVFDNKLYGDPLAAHFAYEKALLDYVDYLENKIESMEEQIGKLAEVMQEAS